ncbi:MAG: helix-turn-helix transcriptional regulator [Proteobacteria bacterium]|nr:helix-turn-helix transcriptional regulator [Pseudomonadota bacterium]
MKDLSKIISLKIKQLRQERGWSLDRAAQETGVSKAMLGQIERQESSPTIATLWKIATGFQTSFSALIENEPPHSDVILLRKEQPKQIHPTDNKVKVVTLFPFDKALNVEMFRLDLLPGCEHLSLAHETGVIEHVIVISGNIEVLVNGRWQKLAKGEGLRFAANQPHGYRNTSAKIASFHDIIHYPKAKKL